MSDSADIEQWGWRDPLIHSQGGCREKALTVEGFASVADGEKPVLGPVWMERVWNDKKVR